MVDILFRKMMFTFVRLYFNTYPLFVIVIISFAIHIKLGKYVLYISKQRLIAVFLE